MRVGNQLINYVDKKLFSTQYIFGIAYCYLCFFYSIIYDFIFEFKLTEECKKFYHFKQ